MFELDRSRFDPPHLLIPDGWLPPGWVTPADGSKPKGVRWFTQRDVDDLNDLLAAESGASDAPRITFESLLRLASTNRIAYIREKVEPKRMVAACMAITCDSLQIGRVRQYGPPIIRREFQSDEAVWVALRNFLTQLDALEAYVHFDDTCYLNFYFPN